MEILKKNYLPLNIQFFASDGEEDVDNLDEDEEVEEDEEDFTDNEDSEDEDESDEEEKSEKEEDVEKPSKQTKEEGKKKQSKEQNEYFKQQRLYEKAQKEALTQAEEAGRKKGLIDAVGGVNPYTKEKIVDDADVQEYLTMREMESKNLDPIQDYHKYVKEQMRKDSIEKAKTVARNKFIANDAVDFGKKYPDVDINKLVSDNKFLKFAGTRLGSIAMAELYEDYNDFLNEISQEVEEKATDKAIKKVARVTASAGQVGTGQGKNSAFYSMEEIERMSFKEIYANLDKVDKSIEYHNKRKK